MKLDSSKVVGAMTRRRETLEIKVKAALDEAARVALEVAKRKAPGKIPGTLKAKPTSGYVMGVRLSSTWSKVRFVEFDTAPHDIAPRNGKRLRFMVGGDTVFARKVHHPGTTGKHFMAAGREAGRIVLRELLNRAISGD